VTAFPAVSFPLIVRLGPSSSDTRAPFQQISNDLLVQVNIPIFQHDSDKPYGFDK
jgi:hypothetical protein